MSEHRNDPSHPLSRAVLATGYGGAENLSLAEVAVPPPGPGQVVVEVRAAGVNPADVKTYSGAFGTDPAKLPLRLGFEAAGVVVELGAGVDAAATGPLAVGDEVIVFRVAGGYADRLLVSSSDVFAKPAALSWAAAAGLMLTGVTATHALTATNVSQGETVLVHGGSGGVGLTAVQLGVARGARVIATAGESAHELIRSLGGEPVTYGPGLLDRVRELAPAGVDAAIDTVGTDEAIDTSLALVADRGRIATIAGFARGAAEGIKLLGGGPGADAGNEVRAAARLQLIREVEAGRLVVPVAGTFALADVAAAHAAVMGRHAPGKFALVP